MSSPAERYARSRADRAHPHLAHFADGYSFALDEFQRDACAALEEGHGVLVAAPTGSGKTIVGEFAVHLALALGLKCFYTTPIKALSNQKFHDLCERHGTDNVGLLTGDNSIRSEAPIVVMTTEVLRNMLYAGSSTLARLGYVVMDEVHYLADRSRGAVWEEVIITLPESVQVVSLSATVSNVEEFGAWLSSVRGDTVTILSEHRPVPLHQHVLVGRKLYPLFDDDEGQVNRQLERIARDDWQLRRMTRGKGGKGHRRPRSEYRAADRVDVVTRLEAGGLLPAICFIFSRAGCAAAVDQCMAARLRLTTDDERTQILSIVDEACAHLPPEDLEVLGFESFREAMSRGIAAHHAGMLPTFKEVVELLFSAGLVKVVFATETLALGINMPARTVVLEKLTKWNGDTHVEITPGEYTQLTGRAGRRGIDVEGHAVTLWRPGFDPRQVAGLASTRTYPLKSSFRPSYNMAVNLVGQVGRSRAGELLEMSFAQFQADRAVVGLAKEVHRADEALSGYAEAAQCDRGDFMEYMAIRQQISEAEKSGSKSRRAAVRAEAVESVHALKRGDVIVVPAGRWAGPAVVLEPSSQRDGDEPRPFVLTIARHARRLAMIDFPRPVHVATTLRIPKGFSARSPHDRRDLANALRDKAGLLSAEPVRRPSAESSGEDPEVARLKEALRSHPCHSCPDREDHARWAERLIKLQRQTEGQRTRVKQRTNSVARQFERVCDVLSDLDYLNGDDVTEQGSMLKGIYSEFDLLLAEALRGEILEGLDPAELAAVISGLSFRSRPTDESTGPRLPTARSAAVADELDQRCDELRELEKFHRLSFIGLPDFGFAYTIWRWCKGAPLDEVLIDSEMAAGDFVRAVKQVADLVAQIGATSTVDHLRSAARSALGRLNRGVVAYSAVGSD